MASTYFTRTPGSSGSNSTFTISVWLKKAGASGTASGSQILLTGGTDGGSQSNVIYFDTSNRLGCYQGTGGQQCYTTTAKYSDINGWYHIVNTFDSTASGSDKIKLWINGVQETVFTTDNRSSFTNCQDINQNAQNRWGSGATANYFDGYMAQLCMADGTAYAASTFGETDSTTGEWKPKSDGDVRSAVTFGTNGYLLTFENASYPGYDYQSSDRSGTTNDWTLVGDGLQSQDNPSNNFPEISMDYMPYDDPSIYIDEAGLYVQSQTSASTYFGGAATMGLSKGKWYWETKGYTGWNGGAIGVFSDPQNSADNDRTCGYNTYDWSYRSDGQVESNNTTQDSGMGTYADGDVIGTYLDLDNNKIYWAKNGTIINSGTGWTITAAASTTHGFYFPGQADIAGSGGSFFGLNFGNGWFKVTKLTGTTYSDAQGQGIFKYSPNDGGASSFDSTAKDFLAICTKNLKSYGG